MEKRAPWLFLDYAGESGQQSGGDGHCLPRNDPDAARNRETRTIYLFAACLPASPRFLRPAAFCSCASSILARSNSARL